MGITSVIHGTNSQRVLDDFRKTATEYIARNGMQYPDAIDDDRNIIILWNGAPNPEYDKTYEMLCASQAKTLFVRSAYNLAHKSTNNFIALFSIEGIETICFFDLDALSFSGMKMPAEQNSALSTLRTLMMLTKREDTEPNEFIKWYWEWQLGNISLNDICADHLHISKRSFYKCLQEYESSPYYYEQCKLLYKAISTVAKRGLLPNKTDFLADIAVMEKDKVLEKYEINSIDFERILISFTKGRKKAQSFPKPSICP